MFKLFLWGKTCSFGILYSKAIITDKLLYLYVKNFYDWKWNSTWYNKKKTFVYLLPIKFMSSCSSAVNNMGSIGRSSATVPWLPPGNCQTYRHMARGRNTLLLVSDNAGACQDSRGREIPHLLVPGNADDFSAVDFVLF